MAEPAKIDNSARMYTTHGVKKNQGQLAIVNRKMALAYVENKQGQDRLIGYTYIEEIMTKACSSKLPEYNVDF